MGAKQVVGDGCRSETFAEAEIRKRGFVGEHSNCGSTAHRAGSQARADGTNPDGGRAWTFSGEAEKMSNPRS